jgi:hypothetical protein
LHTNTGSIITTANIIDIITTANIIIIIISENIINITDILQRGTEQQKTTSRRGFQARKSRNARLESNLNHILTAKHLSITDGG